MRNHDCLAGHAPCPERTISLRRVDAGHFEDGCANIGALIIRIGFWGPLYYKYNKDPPK